MSTPALEELIRLPEETAVQTFFDGGNSAILRRLIAVLAVGAVVGVIGFAGTQDLLRAGLWFVGLVSMLGVLLSRGTRFYTRNARLILMAELIVILLVIVLSFNDPDPGFAFAGFCFPALLVVFRMRTREYFLLIAVFSAAAAWFVLGEGMVEGTGEGIGIIVAQLSFAAIAVTVAMKITRYKRNRFVSSWRRELDRDTESRRMRSELNDAREIQLRMLPKTTPALPWVDFSSISLPATEVGGDYFEYFVLSDSQLVIVIGDVAGHGVASGIVLSGVRSGLHLLRDQLTDPIEVLGKLNGMVRDTAPVRMFVTLQIAVLDYRLQRLTLANAGHQPLLRVPASVHRVDILGTPGLPLGTGLEPGISKVTEPLSKGDTLLFYTDGVPEIRDFHGQIFGEERLVQEVKRSAKGGSARNVRDSILNSVSSFKGDVAQEDDLTLLVVKVR